MLGISVALIAVAALFGIEAYKVRERLPRLVLTGFAVAFALWAALVQQIADLWPKLGAIVANIASNPMVWFVLFIALFFVLRPLWQKGAGAETPPGNDGPPALTADDVEAIVFAQRLADLEDVQKSLAEIEARVKESDAAAERHRVDYDTFKANFDHSVDQMLAPLRDEIREAQAKGITITLDYQNVLGKLALLEEALKVRVSSQDEFQAKMEAWVGNLQESVRRSHHNIDQGFKAILDRERLLTLAETLESRGEELSGPTRGEIVTNWNEWAGNEGDWRNALHAWCALAEVYRVGVKERVMAKPEHLYFGKWKADESLFPDADAVYSYKTFRILLSNFQEEREHVENCVQLAAFAHPSMKGRPDLDEDDELPSSPPPPKV